MTWMAMWLIQETRNHPTQQQPPQQFPDRYDQPFHTFSSFLTITPLCKCRWKGWTIPNQHKTTNYNRTGTYRNILSEDKRLSTIHSTGGSYSRIPIVSNTPKWVTTPTSYIPNGQTLANNLHRTQNWIQKSMEYLYKLPPVTDKQLKAHLAAEQSRENKTTLGPIAKPIHMLQQRVGIHLHNNATTNVYTTV